MVLFGLAVFKVELLAAEVGSKLKKKIDGKAALKKKTRPQFLDFGRANQISCLIWGFPQVI